MVTAGSYCDRNLKTIGISPNLAENCIEARLTMKKINWNTEKEHNRSVPFFIIKLALRD
jgi:hypothetical protein